MRLGGTRDPLAPDVEPGEQQVIIEGDQLLEGKFAWPDRPAGLCPMLPEQVIRGGVVVAHPYPPGGANMDLPVVYHIAKSCRKKGLASLRFNFRSVGQSQGTFSGTDEYRDVKAALMFMKTRLDPEGSAPWYRLPLGLAGWSFGSVMAARAAFEVPELRALALVGFPLHWEHLPVDSLERLGKFGGPVLAVCAEDDHHGSPEEVKEALSALGLDLKLEVVRDADHYLQGRHREVAGLVAEFMSHELGRA